MRESSSERRFGSGAASGPRPGQARVADRDCARLTGRRTGRRSGAGRDAARVTAPGPAAGVHSDRGSATVWSVGAIAVLCVVFGIVLALGQAVVTRHHAAGGADLAALAAADHWAQGSEAACARAERVARAQGARLVRCVMVGEVSDVTAASGQGPFTAQVRARAGPAEAVVATGPGQTGVGARTG